MNSSTSAVVGHLAEVAEILRAHAMKLASDESTMAVEHDLSIRKYESGALLVEGYVDRAVIGGLSHVWWVEAEQEAVDRWTVRSSLREVAGSNENRIREDEAAGLSDSEVSLALVRAASKIVAWSF